MTGARIAGAIVSVLDGPNAGRTATTDTNGDYRLETLQNGNANLSANASGYLESRAGVVVNGTNTLNFTLTPSGPRTTFGAGTHRVGTDIAAGRYYTDPMSGCYWERLSGFGGTLGEVIANEFITFNSAQEIVDILASDRGFKPDAECGTWSQLPRAAPASNTITPGRWLVGSQIAAGTYRTTASSGCYWERLREFTGNLSGIIANDFVSSGGSVVVTISSSDVGFYADVDCGSTWTKAQSLSAQIVITPFAIERNRNMNQQQEGAPLSAR